MVTTRLKRNERGAFDAYAWPGGYPLFYMTADGGVLCPSCVNAHLNQVDDPDDPQWYVIAADANWEDPDLTCDHCSRGIESAYGND